MNAVASTLVTTGMSTAAPPGATAIPPPLARSPPPAGTARCKQGRGDSAPTLPVPLRPLLYRACSVPNIPISSGLAALSSPRRHPARRACTLSLPSTADAFPPHVLREYALIADGERGALIEYDVPQRQLRGNLPQAFVHALMLECSARLAGPPGAG